MDKLIKKTKYLLLVLSLFVVGGLTNVNASSDIVLTFSDSGIEETSAGSGYSISGTTISINKAGTYRIKGNASEGNIEVKKETTGVTLILDNLSLTSSKTAPIAIGKDGADVTIKLVGSNTIIDNEDPDNEFASDISVSSLFEGAAIKVKSGSNLTFTGSGSAQITNNSNNAIKGGEGASITINDGTYDINSAKHGISCDGAITINGGNISIDAFNEGIKIAPDEGESENIANLTINGGKITIDAGEDGIQVLGNIYINNWADITINSVQDAIQTRSNFYMTNGNINIYTYEGYSSTTFSKDEMSAKGIKAKPVEYGEVEDATNLIKITGGTLTFNTSDDAINSAGYVEITRGTLNIQTGDDGVHADTKLTLGTDGGLERDPEINIYNSYEGLEAGTLIIYSGRYYVIANDDGINAAGGASSGYDPNNDGHYNPDIGPENFSLYIYGGEIFINCNGDGLDSNGSMYLFGGNIVIYHEGATNGNSALDRDANLVIDGATVFTAGGIAPSGTITTIGSEQKWYATTSLISGNTKLAVKDNGVIVFNDEIPKDSDFTFYSSPTLSDNVTIEEVGSILDEYSNSFDHNWNSGVVTQEATATTPGIITYTCQDDNITERKTYFYKGDTVLNVYNKTNGVAQVTASGTASTSDFSVNNYDELVTVVSNSPIVVLLNHIGQDDYDELTPESIVGNVFTFRLQNNHSHNLYVALKGDVNLDGTVDNTDTDLIKKSKLSTTNTDYRELTLLESRIADYDNNGAVTIHDVLLIETSSLPGDTTTDKFLLNNGGSVLLNGIDDGTVTIEFVADEDMSIDAIEAYFIPSEQDPTFNQYFTLIGLEKVISGGDETHDVVNGLIYLINPAGYSLNKDDVIYRATFKVDKDTPTGSFAVKLNVTSATKHESGTYSSFVLTNHIIVKGVNDPFTATFDYDEGVKGIDVYYQQDYSTPNETNVTSTSVRNASTGQIPASDYKDGQINFKVKLKNGYVIESITVEPADNYKNLKGPSDTGAADVWRVTKMVGDLEITITTKEATEYTATFVKNTGVKKVDVYYTKDYEDDPTNPFDETDVDTTSIRDGDTGLVDLSGDGQVNFYVTPKNGYKIVAPTVSGNYKNIKDMGNNIYRVTKVNGDLVINLNAVKRIAGILSVDYEQTHEYNSNSHQPAITVKLQVPNTQSPLGFDEVDLVEGTDYTVTYGENINAGTAAGTITITSVASSDYIFDEQEYKFDITQFELISSNVESPDSIIYTGSTLVPVIPVKAHGKTLVEGTDYDISYTNLDGSIGEYVTATVTGKGNFKGTVDNIQLLITDKLPQDLRFVVTEYTKPYGDNYMLAANHTVGDGVVTYQSEDSTVATVDEYGNVTLLKAGDTRITATAAETATYAEATATYELHVQTKVLDITDVHVSNKNYDGNTNATVITVDLEETANSEVLVKGTDFTATGTFDTAEIGKDKDVNVTVTLSPETAEKYSLSSNTFTAKARITLEEIKETDITVEDTSFTYDGTAKEPTVTVVVNGETLVKDQDYKVEYEDNTNAGTAKVKITGLGNYVTDGEVVKTFTIGKKAITPTIEDIDDVSYTGNELQPSVTVKDGTTALTSDDFEVTYSNNTNVGDGQVTISAKDGGNYTFADTSKTFTITPYELLASDITLEYYYVKHDGAPKEPAVTVTVNPNRTRSVTTLVKDVDYTVAYSNNTDVGMATVKVTAISANYIGTPEVQFEISNKDYLTISGIDDNQTKQYTGSPVELAGTLTVSDNTDNITVNDLITTWYDSGDNTISQPTDVGKYYVIYSYDGTNYKGSLKVNFEITKKDSSNPAEMISGLSGIIGDDLSTVTLSSSGLTWDDPTQTIAAGTNSYPATYTENNDSANHTTISVLIPVTGKAKIIINTSVVGSGGQISSSQSNVVEGNQKTITFTPDTGYEVDYVEVNGQRVSISNNQLTLTAGNTELNVSVKFKLIKYKLTITGTYVDLSESGIINVDHGSDKTITIIAKPGYELKSVLVNDVEKISSLSGNDLELTNITEDIKVVAVAEKTVHDVTEGNGQSYTVKKDTNAKFKIDAPLSLFTNGGKIYVDNELVHAGNYTVEDGIIITFTEDYMNSLSAGTHGLKVVFNNGDTATATFKVVKTETSNNPKTNDNIMSIVYILIVSILWLLSMVFYTKLRNVKR